MLRISLASVILGLVVVVVLTACGADMGTKAAKHTVDVDMQAADFRNVQTMTKVRKFYIDNVLGHLNKALAVANSPSGGVYPVGTVIQLVPTEAMVKRRKGFDPATHDWEFFALAVSPTGTTIAKRGTDKVVNRFGGSCAACHELADAKFDMVCEKDHGCAPLPVGDDVFAALQRSDPRPIAMPRVP